jgi:hypothetical protein
MSGTHRSATVSPGVTPRLAIMGGTAYHHARAGIKPRPDRDGLRRPGPNAALSPVGKHATPSSPPRRRRRVGPCRP